MKLSRRISIWFLLQVTLEKQEHALPCSTYHQLIFGLAINMLTSLLLMALGVLNTPDVCEDNGTLSILKILNIRRALKAAVTLLRKEFRNGLWSFSAGILAFKSEKRDDNVVPGLVHVEFRVPWGFCI